MTRATPATRAAVALAGTAVLGLVALLATGCRCLGCLPLSNKPPHVEITGGPRPDGSTFYAIPISWSAWDDDGRIDHSLYAVDDTAAGWSTTREYTTTLVVSAADTADAASSQGWHTFYVKAVDNEGAASPAAQVSFNARTIAPQSRILFPASVASGGGYNSAILGGPSLLLRWTGTDADGVERDTPVAYLFKRLVIPSSAIGRIDVATDLLDDPATPWERIDSVTDTLELRWSDLGGAQGAQYWVFGLRAIDEAGAEERSYLPGKNLFFFAAFNSLQGPALIAQNVNLGQFQWQGVGRDSAQYVFDAAVNLSWIGDPGISGATISGYRWGLDIVDLNNEQDPGWATGWSRQVTSITGLVFRDRTQADHTLVIEARDSNGSVTTGLLRLTLVSFTGERDVAWVDDSYDSGSPGYSPNEPYHRNAALTILGGALAALGRPAVVDTFQCFPAYYDPLFRTPPRLSDLAHYKVVVWDVGTPPNVALADVSATRAGGVRTKPNQIASYLDSGGSLIVIGAAGVRATITPVPTASPIGSTALGPGRGNFAAEYWHVCDQVSFARLNDLQRNGLLGMAPAAWAAAHGVPGGGGFPRLDFDAAAWPLYAATGRSGYETMTGTFHPMTGDEVDALYTFIAAGGGSGPYASIYDGKIDAFLFRRAPGDPSLEDWAYQVAYLSVAMTDMRADQMTGMFTNLLWEILQDKKYGLPLRTGRLASTLGG